MDASVLQREMSSSPPAPRISAFASLDGQDATTAYSATDVESSQSLASHQPSRGWVAECLLWLSFCRRRTYQSDYEVLFLNGSDRFGSNSVRLSDPRLRPRLPKLLVLSLVLISVGGILSVFFLVPRGLSINKLVVQRNVFDISLIPQSLALNISAIIQFKNPNYVDVEIQGTVNLTYYDETASSFHLNKTIPKLTTTNLTGILGREILGENYTQTVVQHCFKFPYKEVFFISGEFKANYLHRTQHLGFDTYRIMKCPKVQVVYEDGP